MNSAIGYILGNGVPDFRARILSMISVSSLSACDSSSFYMQEFTMY
jgi:hypothetical protein